ncbi:MAG: tyrosine-type recombinase/integrase [Actinobacteria bacterium]|jgi:integrase|nr:tyrosine-type recombinase/integrase [Actinomycetota bacterium]
MSNATTLVGHPDDEPPRRRWLQAVTDAPGPTSKALYAPFAGYLEGIGLADRTVGIYTGHLRRADTWLRERAGVPIEAATPAQVRTWADSLPNSWSTRRQARTMLHHWQTWTNHPLDLSAAVRVPRKPKMQSRALDDREAALLEQAAHRAGRRGLAVLLGLYLGMRCSEIAAASWTGYDGAHWSWQRAKTGDLARLPVHPRLQAAVDQTERWGPYLFPSNTHDPARAPHVAPQTIWDWIVKIGEAAGVGHVSTHQLRHTSITRVVDSMGIRVGQEWAGHRDPQVTAGYSRVTQQRLHQAMQTLAWPGDLHDEHGTAAGAAANDFVGEAGHAADEGSP